MGVWEGVTCEVGLCIHRRVCYDGVRVVKGCIRVVYEGVYEGVCLSVYQSSVRVCGCVRGCIRVVTVVVGYGGEVVT